MQVSGHETQVPPSLTAPLVAKGLSPPVIPPISGISAITRLVLTDGTLKLPQHQAETCTPVGQTPVWSCSHHWLWCGPWYRPENAGSCGCETQARVTKVLPLPINLIHSNSLLNLV